MIAAQAGVAVGTVYGYFQDKRDILLELHADIPIVIVTHDLGSLPRTVKNVACLNRSLYYHAGGEISEETLERVYGCAVDLIAHGHPHRVLDEHHVGHHDDHPDDGDAPRG